MTQIIAILIGIWLLKAFVEIAIGLAQIALGLLTGLAGVALYLLSYVVEAVENLWKLASGK